ncbi:hypothetical protein FA95DRAFT_1518032 [Auriscalpium vulgare]|uniref:Uncharacterized protein n=1 Tax=Auriscalpium vulgare TaxID=40419 RepID=A0ACB8RWW5_9AGAM|nr:hypothetical protein FA95DRAFT_1518032 [Auriscalpium vulgare]
MSHSAARKAQLRSRNQRLVRAICILLPCTLCCLYFASLQEHRGWRSAGDIPSTRLELPGWTSLSAISLTAPAASPTTNLVGPLYLLELQSARSIEKGSLTAVIPVTPRALHDLDSILLVLRLKFPALVEVIVLCPEPLISDARLVLRNSVGLAGEDTGVQLTLQQKPVGISQTQALIRTATQTSSEWVLLLDSISLQHLQHKALFEPLGVSFPIGPRGFNPSPIGEADRCLPASKYARPATYLVPPLVMPSSLLDADHHSDLPNTWSSLGKWVASRRPDLIGGVVLGSQASNLSEWCPDQTNHVGLREGHLFQDSAPLEFHQQTLYDMPLWHLPEDEPLGYGVFGLLLPTKEEVLSLSPVLCMLAAMQRHIKILLFQERPPLTSGLHGGSPWQETVMSTNSCHLQLQLSTGVLAVGALVSAWLDSFPRPPDVLVALSEDDRWLPQALRQRNYQSTTLVHLSRADLPYCDWMGTLSDDEWKNWNVPQVELSIITDSRPDSLARLLRSLSEARYYGDTIHLRINMEQTADERTQRVVEDFEWEHGHVFVHHRVVHGGLLPSVVESWYPHTRDTYGILLEDDVEVSPLFFAWAKLAILRYRYGENANRSPQLFGISLYQQKNLELRPDGRQPFNARHLFRSAGLPHPNTPYLSQIPCSWGAVYFPEHWREFHAYLIARHAPSAPLPLAAEVAPDVRSNRWTRSWKKYFIELVFLRGYLMLYPNYVGFASLSTNHLEAGAHVRRQPRDIFDKKKALFSLPLLRLPDENASRVLDTGLLDLPEGRMPLWAALPVLDLHGRLTSEEEIRRQGELQRGALLQCEGSAGLHDAARLLCMSDSD